MSSIITPMPPGKASMRRIPNGFKISKKRNNTKAANAYQRLSPLAASNGIQTPTISSTTMREGSSPQYGSNRLADHTPANVKTMTKAAVTSINADAERHKDNAHQIRQASKAPAVPGATGEKPEPKPVAIITGIIGGVFICNFNYF